MKNNEDANDNNKLYRRELKPVKLKSGIEDIKQDFRERKEQGDTRYGIEILDDAVDTIRNGSTTFIVASPNCLDLSTNVLTRKGFKNITEMTINDKVIGVDGIEYDVIDIVFSPQADCYEIETTDGRKIISSSTHRWETYHYGSLNHDGSKKGYITRTLTSQEIFEKMKKKWRHNKLFLTNFKDTYEVDKKLVIPPYVLGVLIGDGCLTQTGLCYCKPDIKIMKRIQRELPNCAVESKSNKNISIKGDPKLKGYINKVGLAVKSYEKFIPEDYKYNLSLKQKQDLLQGLLDTDGHQHSSYNEYRTTSKRLAEDVQQLAWSLGYRCTIKQRMGAYIKNGVREETRINYRVNISNQRQKAQCVIKGCKYVGKRDTMCVKTNAPRELFVVDNYIVTKNSGKSLWSQIIANNLAKQGKKVMICSCEMGAGLLMERELRMLSGQSMQMVRDLYNANEYEAEMLLDSVYDMPQYKYLDNIEICETAGATVHDIIKMLNAFPEFDYVVVDYIQRIQGRGSDYEVITEAARELQNHARQTRKKIIICSQASRQSNSDAKYGKEIDTSRIKGKGSGSIEEDADVGLSLLEVEEDEGRFILATLFKNRYSNFKNITYKYKVTGRLELKLQQRSL